MDLGLTGKVALVTGSSRGIGRGIALALSDAGCDLLITGRDQEALQQIARSISAKGRKAVVCALDLREPSAPAALVEAARRGIPRPRHSRQ
jgi:3-oxoacyl-[acyl-carrier protein] reductase